MIRMGTDFPTKDTLANETDTLGDRFGELVESCDSFAVPVSSSVEESWLAHSNNVDHFEISSTRCWKRSDAITTCYTWWGNYLTKLSFAEFFASLCKLTERRSSRNARSQKTGRIQCPGIVKDCRGHHRCPDPPECSRRFCRGEETLR